jgi:hypothetical protein
MPFASARRSLRPSARLDEALLADNPEGEVLTYLTPRLSEPTELYSFWL